MKRYTFAELKQYYLGTLIYYSITILYVLYTVIFGDGLPREPISAFMGLFVPVGIWIFISTYGGASLIAFIYFLVLDKWSNARQFSRGTRLFYIFASLAILTCIFDMILFDEYVSFLRLLKLLGVGNIELPEENL